MTRDAAILTKKDIHKLRTRMNDLVTGCKKYMKVERADDYKRACSYCHEFWPSALPMDGPCDLFITELIRITLLLKDVDIKNVKGKENNKISLPRGKKGRIVLARGEKLNERA